MKHSEPLTRANFKKFIKDKKGSAYIEGAMVMPMTCLILIVLIGISMSFHGKLAKQIEEHKTYFEEKNYSAKIEMVRLYEKPV